MASTLYGAAAEYLRTRFRGELRESESNPTIGTAATTIAESNPDRLSLQFTNLSANVIYIGLAETVSASNGIRLDMNGGGASLSVEDDGMLVTRQWYAMASGAGSSAYVLEMSRFISSTQITTNGVEEA
tara:strand:+ start:142 stop:528 length:387 start_codon:yes stop_codon:yes gene_type:complete